MHTDLKKTMTAVGRCLHAEGEPIWEQLRQMYDLTLRLMSQELSVIYDREAFGHPVGQEQQTFARRQSAGVNNGVAVILTIAEPLPAMKKLTEAVEEHWKAMLLAAIGEVARQSRLPYFEKAFVEMEIITPRGSGNARLWDTSNRAIQVILNNLKGVFFEDDSMEHMAFSVVGRWGEKGVTIIRVSELNQSRQTGVGCF